MSSQLDNATELVNRNVRATQTKNITVVDNGSNEVSIPGFPYSFRAQGDKILVAVDVFKSGYECRSCKGSGTIKISCSCDGSSRPGFKYNQAQVDEFVKSLGVAGADARAMMKCQECKGDYLNMRKTEVCSACQGKKSLLELPDTAKSLPTTGVIVSMGPLVDPRLGFKNHDRVLFGGFVGVMIPTKAPGVVFKVMRDIEILCTILGGEDLASFDFVSIDDKL